MVSLHQQHNYKNAEALEMKILNSFQDNAGFVFYFPGEICVITLNKL
jgi:hypothetical protein